MQCEWGWIPFIGWLGCWCGICAHLPDDEMPTWEREEPDEDNSGGESKGGRNDVDLIAPLSFYKEYEEKNRRSNFGQLDVSADEVEKQIAAANRFQVTKLGVYDAYTRLSRFADERYWTDDDGNRYRQVYDGKDFFYIPVDD